MHHVLDACAASGMPVDPRVWLDAPPRSSYPACHAVKAAAEQGLDGPYLRVVREGLMVERRSMDNADALTDAARRVPGLNVERFKIDLQSAAIAEAFAADLERTRAAAPETHTERAPPRPVPVVRVPRRRARRASDPPASAVYDSGDAGRAARRGARGRGDRERRAARRRGRRAALRPRSRRPRSRPRATCPARARRPSSGGWRRNGALRAERVLSGELWQPA